MGQPCEGLVHRASGTDTDIRSAVFLGIATF